MTISEALAFFENHTKIRRGLEMLDKIGLGYVQLGQPSTTLSGGEAQRVKLASQLQRPPTGRTLYILDEPTTGLHFVDVRRLVAALQALVDAGNTVRRDRAQPRGRPVRRLGPRPRPRGRRGGRRGPLGGPYDGHRRATRRAPTGADAARARRCRARRRRPAAEVEDRAISGDVVLRGARLNNLKGVEARFPAGQLTVVTGPSGSGKTSLVFDTLFAEGQRRFVECLSTYARQFLGRLDRPPLDALEGLAPVDRDRPEEREPQPALDGRDDDRDPRLPAPPVRARRRAALPDVRQARPRGSRPTRS